MAGTRVSDPTSGKAVGLMCFSALYQPLPPFSQDNYGANFILILYAVVSTIQYRPPMAAELAALGLVANILQFVDFGTKIWKAAQKIYQLGENGIEDFRNVHRASQDMQAVLDQLKETRPYESDASGPYTHLIGLANDCSLVLSEQLQSLHNLNIPEPTPRPSFFKSDRTRAFKAAVKAAWSHNDLKALDKRLESIVASLVLAS
jgi:hypothetical protein